MAARTCREAFTNLAEKILSDRDLNQTQIEAIRTSNKGKSWCVTLNALKKRLRLARNKATKLSVLQWEIAVCTLLGLQPARTKPGEYGPDCEVCDDCGPGQMIIDAKRYREFPPWLRKVHAKTTEYAKHDQIPMTVFRGYTSEEPDLVVMSLPDFKRFVLPGLDLQKERGWR